MTTKIDGTILGIALALGSTMGGCVAAEGDEGADQAAQGLIVPALAAPDLNVTALEAVGELRNGYCNHFNVTVANGGLTASPPTIVELDTSSLGSFPLGAEEYQPFRAWVPTLAGHRSTTIQMDGIDLGYVDGAWFTAVSAVADPDDHVQERSETNNALAKWFRSPAKDCSRISVAESEFRDRPPPKSGLNVTRHLSITLTPPPDEQVTVDYRIHQVDWIGAATEGTSCLGGADFVGTAGNVTFEPGESLKTVPFVICGDWETEGRETFFADLSASAGPAGGPMGDTKYQLWLNDD
jgi:CARDB/Calx-beta domain